jgi:hypothetical protein
MTIDRDDEKFLEWLDQCERAEDQAALRKVQGLTVTDLKVLHAHYFPNTPKWAIADYRKGDFVDAVFDMLRDDPASPLYRH